MITLNSIEFAAPEALRPLAEEVRNRMEHYRIPASVRRKTGKTSLRQVVDPWLIVVCSPDTPGDPDVSEAIARFSKEGKYHRILTLLAEGNPGESFPQSLLREELEDGTVIDHEPLAANITGGDTRKKKKKLEVEKLRLIAPILGVTFDDLMERRKKQRKRVLTAVASLVLVGALSFLTLAWSRMNVMAEQQDELSLRQAETKTAQTEAEAQRDEALRATARIAAIQAGNALENGDTELGLLLCLDFLPERADVTELTDVLRAGLEQLTAEGYVPVTTRQAYARNRDTWEDTSLPVYKSKEYEEDGISGSPKIPVPEDQEYTHEEVSLSLLAWSREHRYAVYSGRLKPASSSTWSSCVWLAFPDHPAENRFLKNAEGQYVRADFAEILADGSCLLQSGKTCQRILPLEDDKPVPVFDGGNELKAELPFSITAKWEAPGCEDLLITMDRNDVAVFSREPFTLRYHIRNAHTLAYNLEPGGTYWTGMNVYALANGERYLVIGLRFVYDADTGEYLYEIDDNGFYASNRYMNLSSEELLPIMNNGILSLWDLSRREIIRSLPCDGQFWLAGPVDPGTGRNSASIIMTELENKQTGKTVWINWEYREAAGVIPETLEEQIALACRLLNGRELTEAERLDNFLD